MTTRRHGVVWLLMVVAAIALLGQTLGWYDVQILRDLRSVVPIGQPPPEPASPPVAPSVTIPARPLATASPTIAQLAACTASAPRFVLGAASLKAALGARMGEAVECERVVDADGNSEQKTTTGLVYYRVRSNIAAFTNGFDHWALVPTGVVHWAGDDLEPLPDAEPLT